MLDLRIKKMLLIGIQVYQEKPNVLVCLQGGRYIRFGFDNDKFNFEMGRGRLGLGSGDTDIQLSLNQEGPSYDYLSFGVNITNWRIRFINGYLETKNNE